MVSLNPSFASLAVFCGLAAMSLSPLSVSAVAIHARHSSKNSVAGNSIRQQATVIPFPSYYAIKKSAAKDHKAHSGNAAQRKMVSACSLIYPLSVCNNILSRSATTIIKCISTMFRRSRTATP